MAKNPSSPLSPLPDNIELVTEYDAIVIRRSWKSALAYFLIVFALFWNTFMVVWMGIAISQGAWSMAAFGSIHAGVGLGIIYFTIALFLNKTDIRIDTYNLSVKHYPLPWFGQVTFPVESIQQVYCKEKITRGKNGTHVSYELHCLDRNNRSKKLLSGLNQSEQAQFIEREIEKTLGLKDRPVSGEYRK
ncbi:hypothetical protein [Pelagicoccus sp. SDUM812005]|uniref:hypothetical protein n=1 Tax=Pelagicoccus sp. SDUM812005 TaxID=3041257 RepID=UPI0028106A9E|nr:hypothetical protein [Pelagicoccus sp. SDUM812005]MDQ8179778.1 hypothetical protein [Pelagicoccus sp. SDUM812005]